MTETQAKRGAAAVGLVTELDAVEAASVLYLRLWSDGPDAQEQVRCDFTATLGSDQGSRAVHAFQELCDMCTLHGRRPLMRHAVQCKCLGADESCFANFIATAAEGEREDALLMATLLVRVDVAPVIAALAMDVGLALKRMRLRAPQATKRGAGAEHRLLH